MAQPVAEVSLDGPKTAHLGPLLHTLEALLATWCIPLRIFMYLYEVFVNNYTFFLKIRVNPKENKQVALT